MVPRLHRLTAMTNLMRFLPALLIAGGLGAAPAAATVLIPSPIDRIHLIRVAEQQPAPSVAQAVLYETEAWYSSPVWIAVGVLGFIAIIALMIGANRSVTARVED
jgi:hypothetical protein